MVLDGRVAIVTGAGRNIGEAVALAFAREGARVGVVDVDADQAERVKDAIERDRPGSAVAIACDVSSEADVRSMVREVVGRWEGIDVLVNNVAITDRESVLNLSLDEWDRVLRVTLTSVFLCTKYVATEMVRRGRGGRIINMASTSGHRGRHNATAYTAAKAGVLNLTRSVAIQLAPHNIRVNSITPNRIGSPVGQAVEPEHREVANLVNRNGQPRDVAAAALFLASPETDFINAADILVDGGSMSTYPSLS